MSSRKHHLAVAGYLTAFATLIAGVLAYAKKDDIKVYLESRNTSRVEESSPSHPRQPIQKSFEQPKQETGRESDKADAGRDESGTQSAPTDQEPPNVPTPAELWDASGTFKAVRGQLLEDASGTDMLTLKL